MTISPDEGRQASRHAWHAMTVAAALAALESDGLRGLTDAEAAHRAARHGPNELPRGPGEPWWKELLEPLTEPLVLLLLAVAALYAVFGALADALTIFAVILAVVGVELANERRARHAVAALSRLSAPEATMLRGGEPRVIPAAGLVPGDVVLLDPGHRVPADLRLVAATALRVDESSLTGESVPVTKSAEAALAPDTPLGDRVNLAFSGTLVTAGQGRGVVAATGPHTEVARIAGLAAAARPPRTPLQQQLGQLAGWLLWVALGFSVLVPLLSVVLVGRPWREALLEGLTLAFATIPEELPILITIVLGVGAYRLARERAIVKRLQAAETLGSVSVIGTDKTGTLTENRMHVAELFVDDARHPASDAVGPTAARLLTVSALATEAHVAATDRRVRLVGDPTDTALLALAQRAGLLQVREAVRVIDELPFDDRRKRIGVIYERDGARWIAVKGAPESVLPICGRVLVDGREDTLDAARREAVVRSVDAMAARGQRVIACAERRLAPDAPPASAAAEADLTLVGLAGLEDPPRPEVPDAVRALRAAGVRVLMLTGDHPATARAIADRVGLEAGQVVSGRDLAPTSDETVARLVRDVSVFARITPEDKLRIVRALQDAGQVVAVTGDGVNDAPALRQAAIGIAMGRRGTDVAREAADLVLSDDNFATVATAVRAGRMLYENLWKAVRYYLAAKVGLIATSLAAVLMRLPLPFVPVQIIVLELFMDLGASTTFVVEPPEEDVMNRPPRDPRRPFMDRVMVAGILAGGLSLGAAVLLTYVWATAVGLPLDVARTAAFVAWMAGHLVLAAHMRSARVPLLARGLLLTRPFLAWGVGVLALVVVGTHVPFLGQRLHLTALPTSAWLVALGTGLLLPSWWEIVKWRARAARDRGAGRE